MKNNYLTDSVINGQKIQFPIYLPDATQGVIRSLDSIDLENAKIEGLVTNAYHLKQKSKNDLIQNSGIKSLMNWNGLITTDSGGFQVMSLIQKDPQLGKITDEGIILYSGAQHKRRKFLFTPEISIQTQFNLGADIMICLDEFTPPKATPSQIDQSIKRTTEWAKRSKQEFLHQLKIRNLKNNKRPILLGVIQGGFDKAARKISAEQLQEISFDGYGYGGWPLDENGKFDVALNEFIANLMPNNLPKFALGIGSPQDIVEGFKVGFNLFDCVLPTRDARHQRLYIFSEDPEKTNILNTEKIHSYLYISRKKYQNDTSPISAFCDCHTCRNFSRAYIHHLFKVEKISAWRLSTIHNLRTYSLLIEHLRKLS